MNTSIETLSDITIHMKYAKYLPDQQRRETWEELVLRNCQMHQLKYPQLKQEIDDVYELVFQRKILPSMRSMQFGGKPIEISPNRVYNCAYMPVDNIAAFSEAMFLLLGGTGVGYSVQYHHVEELPAIVKPNPNRTRRFLIGDSIEGWADSVKVLFKAYSGMLTSTPIFDYSDIRTKGEALKTSGGKAPGPGPLKEALVKIQNILDEKETGDKLTPIECHDIICHIADAVLAGGIRRAALISLFSADDMNMITAKSGQWWEKNPQRGRANNSAVLLRHRVRYDFFMELWDRIKASGSGEPGIYLSNDKDWGTNPCCEIALRPFQFCNLTEINASSIFTQQDLEDRVMAAAFIGTLQAGYTDFHYLRDIWKRNTEKDALLGVSLTGIASNRLKELDLEAAVHLGMLENARVAKLIGVNKAARVTCVKPAGTTSLVLGTSSGIHAWHSPYYIRRIRVGKMEAIYHYLLENNPKLIEDDYARPHDTAIISIPQKAPEGSLYRAESAVRLLERIKHYSLHWVSAGHREGMNTHNVSATISVRDDEWDEVANWMWINRHYYNGLTVLPYEGGKYTQAPFEEIDEETYKILSATLTKIDLSKIIETFDDTDLKGEVACASGFCEIV